jgi:hypothetical protein
MKAFLKLSVAVSLLSSVACTHAIPPTVEPRSSVVIDEPARPVPVLPQSYAVASHNGAANRVTQ